MNKRYLSALTAVALVAALPLQAAACEALREGPSGRVMAVTDGDSVVLESGERVRLIGMQAPKLSLGRDGFEEWPLAEEARAALEEMALGALVHLRYGGEELDRHGRILAHMFVQGDTEIWAQWAMVTSGFARVYSFADNRLCLEDLMRAEAQARVDKRGIWSNSYYKLRFADRPGDLLERVDHYELVEGRVLAAEKAGSLVYLNFGRYWKEDFTVVIDKSGQKIFAAVGVDPLAYDGALLRVRGWIEDRDGPRIEVSHPEQIEVLALR